MDLNLQIKPKADDSLVASYSCPCGCNPRLGYARGTEHAQDGCCCGNEFAVGPAAADHLRAHDGFRQEVQVFQAPWGQPLQAVWTIGAPADPGESAHDHDHGAAHSVSDASEHGSHEHESHEHESHEHESTGSAIDPVCGMTVDRATARARDLALERNGVDYFFCGKGCRLEFGDDPERYLAPGYVPSM